MCIPVAIAVLILVLLVVSSNHIENMEDNKDTKSTYMLFPKQCETQSKTQCNYSRLYDNPRLRCEWDISSNRCGVSTNADISSNTGYPRKVNIEETGEVKPFNSESDTTSTDISNECPSYTNKSYCELKNCEWNDIDKLCRPLPKVNAFY